MKNLFWTLLILSLFACNSSSSSNESEAVQAALSSKKTFEKIPWVGMDEVEYVVGKKPRKVIVDVYTPWCGPCKMMDRNTFTDAGIIDQIGHNFYAVKFNAEGPDPINFQGKEWANPKFDPKRVRGRNAPHQLSSFFSVRAYPTIVVLDENFKIIEKIVGYKTPPQLKQALKKYM